MKITVKIPCRGRPNALLTTIKNWMDHCTDRSKVEFIVSLDADDKTMSAKIKNALNLWGASYFIGENKSKIEAVNADMIHCTGDIVMVVSDDSTCLLHGWEMFVADDMRLWFPDTDGCIHYPDGFQTKDICTHVVMGRKYYNRFGYIYHPDYLGLFADMEHTIVANSMHRMIYLHRRMFRHDHPLTGARPHDTLNGRDMIHFERDKSVFMKRRSENFQTA